MNPWFRLYSGVMNDPKLLLLPEATRWHWLVLLCVSSENNGVIPSLEVAALALRLKPSKAGEAVAKLAAAGLLDRVEGGYFQPHNWNSRQYKSDVSTDRVKQHRERQRNVSSTVSETPPETEAETERADAEDARARPPLIRPEALTLADDIALLCGHDLKFLPPGFCGAAMRVESWLAHGWQREMILAAVAGVLAKRSGKAPDSVNYFEKPIAEFIAKAARPLPEVVIDNTPEKIHVRPEANSAVAGADRVLARMQEFDQPAGGGDGSPNNVRLLSKG
jgi:hypothetical protein